MRFQNSIARKKAELIKNCKIYIPEGLKLPYPLDRSTAGPNSGLKFITLTFNNLNIKMEVSKNPSDLFILQKEDESFKIKKEGEIFLENVNIIPTVLHAPNQAFINLNNRCIYNCAFCSMSKEKQEFLQKFDREKFVKLLTKTIPRNGLHAIALTSGIYPDNKTIINMMSYIIHQTKEQLPDIPIGVESCIFEKNEITLLKKAGAEEIKINLQIPDENLFEKICPSFRYKTIITMLKEAAFIFGKGKVTSNLIYGLGESDETVIKTTEMLASLGVIPTLRKIRINKINKKKLEGSLSGKIPTTSSDRILYLATEQKRILTRYNLSTKTFKTMCHPCGCCDIVPFWDI